MEADRVEAGTGPAGAPPRGAPGVRPVGRATLVETALLAWWWAVLGGLLYAAVLLFRQRWLGQLVWVSPDVVWMAPAANLGLFFPVALVLGPIVARLRAGRALACGAFAFLATFALLLPFGQIARWASAIIALGIAVQAGRFYAARAGRLGRPLLIGATMLSVVAAGLGVGRRVWGAARRERALAALPSPPRGAPNVLLIILDTVRAANLSLYGYGRPTTPRLEQWAAQGTAFDLAIATAPWTLPSHGSLFSGRWGGELGGDWRKPIAAGTPMLAEVLRERGYHTGGFVANLLYTSYESGLARGFVDYRDYRPSPRLALLHTPLGQTGLAQRMARSRSLGEVWSALRRFDLAPGRLPADDPVPAHAISDDFLAWQRTVGERPFFAFLNYFDAHGPYRAPDSFRVRLGVTNQPEDRYDAAIAYLDAELDRVFQELERRDVLDRTIVAVVSDHGELFGEHGLTGHANGLYLPLLRVPLVLRFPPSVPAGLRTAGPASLRELPATLLELAGLGNDPRIPGPSLTRLWDERGAGGPAPPIIAQLTQGQNVDSTFPNARTGLAAVLEAGYHYIRNGFGDEQLYDYRADSLQQHNLVGRPEHAEALTRLRGVLDSVSPRPAGSR
jgi:arylsulfatase A-like enzyme